MPEKRGWLIAHSAPSLSELVLPTVRPEISGSEISEKVADVLLAQY